MSLSSPKSFTPFLVLPTSSVVGDYQILFDLNSTISVKVYVPPEFMAHQFAGGTKQETSKPSKEKTKSPSDVQGQFMCIDADAFLDLCDLYPQTADDLKMRALERR